MTAGRPHEGGAFCVQVQPHARTKARRVQLDTSSEQFQNLLTQRLGVEAVGLRVGEAEVVRVR